MINNKRIEYDSLVEMSLVKIGQIYRLCSSHNQLIWNTIEN